MMEFIVLGLVPGTDFQITFSMVGYVALLILAVALVRMDLRFSKAQNTDVPAAKRQKQAKA